jgi:ribosomal protein S18 acetylase RimI-like enzyme
MQIRRARTDELDAIGEVTVLAYGPHVDESSETGYVTHLRDAATRDREAELWVAVDDDDTVLGSVTVCPEGSPWRELARPGEGEIRMLSVAPAAQGRGAGHALAAHAIEEFRAGGAHGVVLCTMPEMTGAHRIYQRLGFARDPSLDWSPVPGVDLLGFRLDLRE